MDRNIRCHLLNIPAGKVALRKESVDRNVGDVLCTNPQPIVALRKESVDRNNAVCANNHKRRRRSPQGERG